MTNISSFYKLAIQQPNLDFVDVKLNTDNLLFIDPRLIENSKDPIAKEMQKRVEVFWAELIKHVRAKDIKKIYYLLSGLKEPNETRLGYSFSKCFGNSVADKLKPKIIDAIQRNKAVKSGVLSHFADVELFIEDIGSDRISDITTKIIKDVLIEYTQQQCKLYKIPMKEVMQDDIFDHTTSKWVRRKVKLPVYFGKPILFVPKTIVRLENSAGQNVSCFYRYAIRHFIVHDKEMLDDVSPSGKDGKILLRDIKAEYPISKESLTNWGMKYGKLLVDYKTDHLNGRLKPLSDAEIMAIVYDKGFLKTG
ncbi:hypothetical protein [Flagellimonas amoyensis]|uniref:hypothetical protein n=1 Tax=Flagellimonas amoyensis TaxID=2169401 RepID=UPI000D35F335|nr:hypothetical protein [Allomuricauda amoyensis]